MAPAHIPNVHRQKLDKKLCFVGYSIRSKGYSLLDEKSQKLVIRQNVTFNIIDFSQTFHKEAKPQDTVDVDVNEEANVPEAEH